MQDGTTLQSKVLVGADGNLSTVRKQLLDDGLPRYAGLAIWRAMGWAVCTWSSCTLSHVCGQQPGKQKKLFLRVKMAHSLSGAVVHSRSTRA